MATLLQTQKYPLSRTDTHTHIDGRKAVLFPFTGEQKKETPRCFSYLAGESEGGGKRGEVCAECVPTESFPHDGPRAVFVNGTPERQGVR